MLSVFKRVMTTFHTNGAAACRLMDSEGTDCSDVETPLQ